MTLHGDALWRIDKNQDIVVTFEEPIRIMFWHGTSYGASYVTENERWMGDQSLESNIWMVDGEKFDKNNPNPDHWGCAEHMSDKQCRYSHVRLIENNQARVIIHWRYNPSYITYGLANVDPLTGWSDWADEYFVIYPDAVAVRHQILWSTNCGVAVDTKKWPAPGMPWHQFQETIFFNQPGTRPEDNIEWGALSVANMENQSYTYMWGKDAEMDKSKLQVIKSPNIQMTNLKSQYKPYIIFEPGVSIDPWLGNDFKYSWNHWPVGQLPSDGRVSQFADRPSHNSLSCGAPILHHNEENNSHMAVMLYGLKKGKVGDLVPLARSWNFPAELKVIAGDITYKGYEKYERAFILECKNNSNKVEFQLKGSSKTPVVNPAIVLRNWGQKEVVVKVNGVAQVKMKDYRAGFENKIDRTDLVLWFKIESDKDLNITVEPQD